eukprot:TRINITY_DN75685_c0_g1_i1.p1 TRINITY_DN75685_c0_g1~~TRINITY_DN75685_c0_g1_i1.p1  ORF type:complete len:334 (-),score=50.13 TRINITY_DN75685_c0_g1_i1:18-1019(-)
MTNVMPQLRSVMQRVVELRLNNSAGCQYILESVEAGRLDGEAVLSEWSAKVQRREQANAEAEASAPCDMCKYFCLMYWVNPVCACPWIICGLPAFYFLWHFYDPSLMQAAVAFQEDPKLTLHAKVLEKGYVYTGNCDDVFGSDMYGASKSKECDAGESVNLLCKKEGWSNGDSYIPAPVQKTQSLRRLSCTASYVAWALVEFEIDGKSKRRCAYRLGVAHLSELQDSDKVNFGIGGGEVTDYPLEETQAFLKSIGESWKVWMQDSTDHCVVGLASLTHLVQNVKASKEYWFRFALALLSVPVGGFLAFVFGYLVVGAFELLSAGRASSAGAAE